ncbi:unnamed protein product, partial [Amoebophrya sp. A25]|eukprot:GSA25T00006480001.1
MNKRTDSMLARGNTVAAMEDAGASSPVGGEGQLESAVPRPSVHPDSLCSGAEDPMEACWTTRDAEWRQITFHSLVSLLILKEMQFDPEASLLLLPAFFYLSHAHGGKDYGVNVDQTRLTRNELLREFLLPVEKNRPDDRDQSTGKFRPPDVTKQERTELRLVRLTISGADLLRLVYASSYLQYDWSKICVNDMTDLNLPKVDDRTAKKAQLPGFAPPATASFRTPKKGSSKAGGGIGAGRHGGAMGQITKILGVRGPKAGTTSGAGMMLPGGADGEDQGFGEGAGGLLPQHTLLTTSLGSSTVAMRRREAEAAAAAELAEQEAIYDEIGEDEINMAVLAGNEEYVAEFLDAKGGLLEFPPSGVSSDVSGYDPDERNLEFASSSDRDEKEDDRTSSSGSTDGESSGSPAASGAIEDDGDQDDEEGQLISSKKNKKKKRKKRANRGDKDEEDLGEGGAANAGREEQQQGGNTGDLLLPPGASDTETEDRYDPNAPLKTVVPSDFQILTVFGEPFDRRRFYNVVVPGSLLLH